MKKTLLVLTVMVLSILFVGVPAWAAFTVDPSTLFIGTGAGTPNATGNLQNDPTFVGTTNFSIYQNSGGAIALNNPLVLLLAVPNTGTLTGSISSATLYNPYSVYPTGTSLTTAAGVNPSLGYGSLTNTSGAFQTNMTSGDLYTAVGLGGVANNSFNWSNLTGATLPNGSPNPDFGVTSFSIYAFSISSNTTNLADKGLVDIIWSSGGLPTGTFIAAFGAAPANGNGPHHLLTPYSTPFTQSGLTSPPPKVPEPSSLLLLGSGLLGFAFWGRKRFTK